MMIQIDELAQVQVVVPSYARAADIQRFLAQKSYWIVDKIKKSSLNSPSFDSSHPAVSPRKKFEDGEEFLFLGKRFPLKVSEDTQSSSMAVRLSFDGEKFESIIPSKLHRNERQTQIKERFLIWYQMQAKEILGGRVFHYARVMAVDPKDVAIRNHKRIWGSCNYRTQTIHLNWQIVMSPLDVLDYVVVHELCHLRVPNHSKKFWQSVANILPQYKQHRLWLKTHQRQMLLPS